MSKGDHRELMAHEEAMQMHQANLNGVQHASTQDRARLLETVIESELVAVDESMANFRAKDFPLSNFDEEVDTTEFKWMQEIADIFVSAAYPHPDSGLQGLARAWAAGDPNERKSALSLHEMAQNEAYKQGTFSRAKRGEEMAQQETSAKQVTETHAVRDNGSSGGGGILGRLRD